MSKTFKSAYPGRSNQSLGVVRADNRFRVSVDHGSDGARGIIIAPSDAPALALAILEAAGYTEDDTEGTTGLTHFALAMSNLRTGIEEQERATAEARELAELEAEAFEYLKAVYTVTGAHIPAKFSDLNAGVQSHFLIIARRAREMRTEK